MTDNETEQTSAQDRSTVHRAAATADGSGVRSDDGSVEVSLAVAGDSGAAAGTTSPEHLMAAALAGCLRQAVSIAASSLGDTSSEPTVEAVVTLRTDDGPGYNASFELTVSGLDGEHADDVLAQATTLCPFTTALEGRSLTVTRA